MIIIRVLMFPSMYIEITLTETRPNDWLVQSKRPEPTKMPVKEQRKEDKYFKNIFIYVHYILYFNNQIVMW